MAGQPTARRRPNKLRASAEVRKNNYRMIIEAEADG